MLAGFGVIVSSGITLVVRVFHLPCPYAFSHTAQIFFPRSIEDEIAANDAGIRSRGLFSSRKYLTFVSQEQELYGTYDPEETPVDSKAPSPSSFYHKPMSLPSSAPPPPLPRLLPLPREPVPLPLPPLPALTPPPPLEFMPLAPNRRPPSLDNLSKPPANDAEMFNNPATKVSRVHSLRSPTGVSIARAQDASSPPPSGGAADRERGGRSYLDLGGRSRW